MVTIWPMTGYLKNPENVKELKDYAQKALDTYNAREVCSIHSFYCLSSCSFPFVFSRKLKAFPCTNIRALNMWSRKFLR